MSPPLPPSSKAPRRRRSLLGGTNSADSNQQTDRGNSNNEIGNVASRFTNRDARSVSSSGRYAREHRHLSSASSSTSEYDEDDRRNRRLPPTTNTYTKSKTTMTTDDEIERIREMRARRQRAERQERGGGERNEKSEASSNLSTRRSSPRASIPSIARQDLEKSGLVRKGIRRSDGPNILSSSGDDRGSEITKNADEVSRRSDIEARLAARRNRRFSTADGRIRSTTKPKRHSSEIVQRSTQRSLDRVTGSGAKTYEEANLKIVGRTKSADRLLPANSTAEVQKSESRNSTSSGEELQRLPSRTTPSSVSERLRERREARERDRKEREKKYDLKSQSSESQSTRNTKNDDIKVQSIESQPTQESKIGKSIELQQKQNSKSTAVKADENKTKTMESNRMVPELEKPSVEDETIFEDWSIRLCVISATDLPANVVPNMPLCPVLKMGLVELPVDINENARKKSLTSMVMEVLGEDGVEKLESANVRSTTDKILSKRDNGAIDFHQEYRWDNLKRPETMGLCVELFARAVRTPSNYMLSPPAIPQQDTQTQGVQKNSSATDTLSVELTESSIATVGRGPPTSRGVSRTSSLETSGTMRGLWNRNNKKQNAEMQAAEAAAAVARILVDESGAESKNDDPSISVSLKETSKCDHDVSLRYVEESINTGLTRDVRLGSVVIPLAKLPQAKGIHRSAAVRLEEWHQLEIVEGSCDVTSQRKKPSVFLEISLSSSEVLDDSEDELEDGCDVENDNKELFKSSARANASFSRRASMEAMQSTDEQEGKKEKTKTEEPILEPGIVDFVAVVGCKDIGNQKNDDGMKGWVKSTPECVVLEQFPPNNEFHLQSGRKALLPEMVQWFCYPEGAKLWRGTAPPSHSDLNLKSFSAATPPNAVSSNAAFDACLGSATSFSWFVIASNSDEYGSSLVKTYGAVIRFYVPAPTGIDSTQDDFAQAIMGGRSNLSPSLSIKRLWVPVAICLTSNLPMIGIMEALLLRTCEELATISDGPLSGKFEEIQQAIGNIILNYQKPIAGAVNCSIPFLAGDRFLLSLPPSICLPPLPHGRAVLSACRLLGAEGFNYLLAAILTECKVLLHSENIAELAMVAEVITALTYPFTWSLPYIPVLPVGMIEFVEAPLSYLLGIPSCNLKLIDPRALDDTVVLDLNKSKGLLQTQYSAEKPKEGSKHPAPLPASISTNISNAVHKLLRAEEEMEEEYGGSDLLDQSLPRLETESLAEREFRVTVAIEICGLLRGYQDCVGPVFNRDKFLKTAPALYEERREYKMVAGRPSAHGPIIEKTRIVSSRSKRFLSSLVSGQNFQQLLENLDGEHTTFFHEILEIVDDSTSDKKSLKKTSTDDFDYIQAEKNVALLMKSLQKNEDKIPTFCVKKGGGLNRGEDETMLSLMYHEKEFNYFGSLDHKPDSVHIDGQNSLKVIKSLLSPIAIESTTAVSDSGMQAVSMEYLTKLETTPWQYNPLFNISTKDMKMNDKIKLREAIGERRFRAWKMARDKKSNHDEDLAFLSESTAESAKQGSALDLTTLVTSAKNDSTDSTTLPSDSNQHRTSTLTPAQQRIAAAKNRDIIRRCLDKANLVQSSGSHQVNPFVENGRDLMAEAEKALRNPSAQLFLISILSQRSRLDNKRTRTMRQNTAVSRSASRLDRVAFDCLIQLSCAMLDSCMEYKEYEMAYRLLSNSAGFIMVEDIDISGGDENEESGYEQSMIVITMTSRIGLHPIFADIGVWEAVMRLHLRDRKAVKKSDEFKSFETESDDEVEEEVEYEAAVATLYEMVGYGIPGEELSRFAMRSSQEHGWFCDDRGRQLLMLARRISIRRDQADVGRTGKTGDIDMVRKGTDVVEKNAASFEGSPQDKPSYTWRDVAWCHPAAPSRTAATKLDASNSDIDTISTAENFMKRTPVTALASFGSSIVASGGLDGSVFLAHCVADRSYAKDLLTDSEKNPKVRGIHLDWGSASRARTGSTSDGEYGVGAVSCLAAACGDTSHDPTQSSSKDTRDIIDEIDIAESMEGRRIIAGTTAGDLRVWSVKDVYTLISMTKNGHEARNTHTNSRLKYSLRGRALSGHRGGVTCIDVPSRVYRPDSLVTGGADGLIKLWALRAPTGNRRANATASGGDALSTLSGHAGRILCIKTAWHGDHLLSGGADRTIRVWDLATSSGKCIHRLCGHFGWITNIQYWGPNTIVSASTDRSVALWDARVRCSPLFILRNHLSPISDLLVGSRTDPYMVSASADGTIATWDFRSLSNTITNEQSGGKNISKSAYKVVRLPSASIDHDVNMKKRVVGSVYLSRDVTDPINSFLSVGSDAVLRKWDIATGDMIEELPSGHCDTISSFESYTQGHGFTPQSIKEAGTNDASSLADKGFLTSSLDGTIRLRKLVGICNS